MNWVELINVAAPACVGAGSAILSAWLTHRFAERRHLREMETRSREMRQRLLESLIPQRIAAYQQVFVLLNQLKSEGCRITNTLEELTPHLMWIESSLSSNINTCLKSDREDHARFCRELASLQTCLRQVAGVVTLEEYFADSAETKTVR